MIKPFETNREHLYAELARLDLLIQRQIWRWRQTGQSQSPTGDEFRGLYVSEAQVDAILNGVYPGSEKVAHRAADQRPDKAFRQAIERATAEIARRKAAAAEQGIPLRLEQLRALFDLTPFDVDALLVCLAPELELRYERLYAYLQDDVTRKRPTVDLILNLLCATSDERLAARTRFALDAPLLRGRLATLFGDPAQPHPPLLAHYVKIDPRVLGFLLQQDTLDTHLRDFCQLSHPTVKLDALLLCPNVKAQLNQLTFQPFVLGPKDQGPSNLLPSVLGPEDQGSLGQKTKGLPTLCPWAKGPRAFQLTILLQGDDGTGKGEAAQAVCAEWGQPLLSIHLPRALSLTSDLTETARLAVREAYLSGAALYWHGYDALFGNDPSLSLYRETFHAALFEYPVVSFLPVEDTKRQPDRALLHAPRLVRVSLPRPDYALRHALWSRFLDGHTSAPDTDLSTVAGRFRLTSGHIRDAAADACHRATQRPPGQQSPMTADLFAGARARTGGQLAKLAKKIEPRHTWADLVLPDDQIAQLYEMCDQIRYRHVVLDEWGFDRKLSMGKGLNALFAGPSGTGKTMAAEVIVGDLGLDLYKIDLSTVVSKYIGETEKNLERIFRAARNSNAILFFDEADALFGKRSEVRDAHDRYANVEISYLLQKMEEYDGLVILTSNLNKNMDEAFVRRMHFTVEFPYPEEADRLRLWQTLFPAEAPRALDVDLDLLASRYRLTGGNIRNVILGAAFLAARDGGVIGMDHLLWATRREFQKLGRLVNDREFQVGSWRVGRLEGKAAS